MDRTPDTKAAIALHYIGQASGEDLEAAAYALVCRYAELYPDYEVGLLSLPKNDPEGQKRCIEGLLEFLQKAKTDSLG